MITRIGVAGLALTCVLAILFLVALRSNSADLDDDAVPELVELYILLPCDFLRYSSRFLKIEVEHIVKRYAKCRVRADEKEVRYGEYLCEYVELERQFTYEHLKSVESARQLMCIGDVRKSPEYDL